MIKKRVTEIMITISLIVFLLYYFNHVLIMKRTDGIVTMQNYYIQEKNTVDVLLLGSSHIGMNLDTAELWENYGIASYDLWGSIQPFWNSYYFLKER